MKKGQMGINEFVIMTALVAIFIVLLIVLTPIKDALTRTAESSGCQWGLFLSSVTRTPGLGIENIPAQCKANRVTVTKNDLDKMYRKKAINAFERYEKNQALYPILYEQYSSSKDENQLVEWELNAFMAEQMRNCWTKVWKGKLPLFDEWWNWVDLDFFNLVEGDFKNEKDRAKIFLGETEYGPILNVWGPPTFCVLCSRVKFDNEVKSFVPNVDERIFTAWLKGNPIPTQKTVSYYEDILEGQSVNDRIFFPEYSYDTSDPQAILYKRVNTHKIGQWAGDILPRYVVGSEKDYNSLRVSKFEDIARPSSLGNGEGCYEVVA